MKKIITLFLVLFTLTNASSQILKPAKWTTKVVKLSDNEFNLVISGTIDGVKEYWVIDPATRESIGFSLTDHLFTDFFKGSGEIRSQLLANTFAF